jgi:hypothetical protein
MTGEEPNMFARTLATAGLPVGSESVVVLVVGCVSVRAVSYQTKSKSAQYFTDLPHAKLRFAAMTNQEREHRGVLVDEVRTR